MDNILDANKKTVSRYYNELLNQGRIDIADELFSEELLRDEQQVPGKLAGRGAVESAVRVWNSGFSDFHESIEELIAEGDLVVARFQFTGTHDGPFLGIEPTGRKASMPGIEIFRVRDGRITDVWYAEQVHELLEQLGAISPVNSGY